jgi:hypothetical protein
MTVCIFCPSLLDETTKPEHILISWRNYPRVLERRPDPILLDFQFGGLDMFRSAAKSCLVLWATLVGNEEIIRPCYQHVRQFVLGQRTDFPGGDKTDLDSRIYDFPETITAEHGPAFNLIYVKSDRAGRVVGHFTMYNIIGVSIVLAEAGGSPDRQTALISNPTSISVISSKMS